MGNPEDAMACLGNFIEFHADYGDLRAAEFLKRAGDQMKQVADAATSNQELMRHGLPYAIYKTIDADKGGDVTSEADRDRLHAYLAFLTAILNLLEAKKGKRPGFGLARKELEDCRIEIFRKISA